MICTNCHREIHDAGEYSTVLVTSDDDDRSCYGDDLPLDQVGRIGHVPATEIVSLTAGNESARRAERIAMAILDGSATERAGTFDDLRLANRETAVVRDVAAVSALRQGARPWSVPRTAPWAGF